VGFVVETVALGTSPLVPTPPTAQHSLIILSLLLYHFHTDSVVKKPTQYGGRNVKPDNVLWGCEALHSKLTGSFRIEE
jgi:hypothetical protein